MAAERPVVCVIGNGGWGTALSLVALANGADVRLWGIDADYVAETERLRENPRYLTGVPLPPALVLTHDAAAAARGAQLLVSAVPTQFLRETMSRIAGELRADAPVLSVSKGLENRTLQRPTEVLVDVLGPRPVGVLSGPSHAEEVARGGPTSVVVASADPARRPRARRVCATARLWTTARPEGGGVAPAAAVKNVIAIAAGVCDGLGLGDNAKAALITRGNAEITRLGRAMGARAETFWGLAGIGDLITTCVSRHGRNRGVGERLGRGERLDDVVGSMAQVAEGVRTTESVVQLARRVSVEMPISQQVHRILFEGQRPRDALQELMTRAPRFEREGGPRDEAPL